MLGEHLEVDLLRRSFRLKSPSPPEKCMHAWHLCFMRTSSFITWQLKLNASHTSHCMQFLAQFNCLLFHCELPGHENSGCCLP